MTVEEFAEGKRRLAEAERTPPNISVQ